VNRLAVVLLLLVGCGGVDGPRFIPDEGSESGDEASPDAGDGCAYAVGPWEGDCDAGIIGVTGLPIPLVRAITITLTDGGVLELAPGQGAGSNPVLTRCPNSPPATSKACE
jgi:hypothetical protein